MGTVKFNARGKPAMDYHSIQGGVEILLVTSSYRKQLNSGPMGHLAPMQTLKIPFFYNKIFVLFPPNSVELDTNDVLLLSLIYFTILSNIMFVFLKEWLVKITLAISWLAVQINSFHALRDKTMKAMT